MFEKYPTGFNLGHIIQIQYLIELIYSAIKISTAREFLKVTKAFLMV